MKFKNISRMYFLNREKFKKIECQNCGKYYKLDKVEQINIGEEQFYICEECIDTINKFKQRHQM